MFFHTKQLQYNAKPDRPDPIYAKKLQEVLGGQWGEISVMMSYLFQGWNCRAPAKYRDTTHQNQWLAAIDELVADGLEETPVPSAFPQELEYQQVSYQLWNCSAGTESQQGRWASGPSIDGKGEFEYLADPRPLGEEVQELGDADPLALGTMKQPVKVMPPGTEGLGGQRQAAAD